MGAKCKSWKEGFVEYWASKKGSSLVMNINMSYILIVTVVGLAVQLCAILEAASISQMDVKILFSVFFTVSAISLAVVLFLGALHKLTTDNHHLDQTSTNFTRAGAVALGTGGMIYFVVEIIQMADTPSQCRHPESFFWSATGIIFIAFQTAMVMKYSKLRINKSVSVSIISRFLLAQVMATNAALWITLIGMEAEAEADHMDDTHHQGDGVETTAVNLFPAFNNESSIPPTTEPQDCTGYDELEHLIKPYAFPMLIEYCVVAGIMLSVVWENCGVGLDRKPDQEESSSSSNKSDAGDSDSGLNTSVSSPDMSISEVTPSESATVYEFARKKENDKFFGMVAGWFVLCVTFGLTITTLYFLYSDEIDFKDGIPYGLNVALSGLCIIVGCGTFLSLSKLTFYDEELREAAVNMKGVEYMRSQHVCEVKHRMDQRLSTATLLSLVTLKLFTGISAIDTENTIILVDSVVSVAFAIGQNLFLTYAANKRVKTHKQLHEKPGRSGLEFLRIINFALWVTNTFLLKHPYAKESMNQTFGEMEWAVLSNVFQPLAILYYFHAMITTAEIISNVYASKFVGVIRHSKAKKRNSKQYLTANNATFELAEF